MIVSCKNGVEYYQFENLANEACLNHGVFTRRNGQSRAPFASLNVGFGLGDPERNVYANRRLIDECMESRQSIYLRQVHGNRVVVMDDNGGLSSIRLSKTPPVGDAMITDVCECYLVIQVADCQPVLFYDPAVRVVAAAHCGWRGSLQDVIGATVRRMTFEFGCSPKDIQVGVGPSLGPCCAEFVNYRTEFPPSMWKYKAGNNRFDLWALSGDQLQNAGIPAGNIHFSNLCTRCRSDLFFSYREERPTGRFAAVIGLRDSKQ